MDNCQRNLWICGQKHKIGGFQKGVGSLKEYEALRERTANGKPNPAPPQTNFGVDPDAVAAIRRQRLSEISLWFNPHNMNSVTVSQVVSSLLQLQVQSWKKLPLLKILLLNGLWRVLGSCLLQVFCSCMAPCSSCWKENCQEWPAYSSRRRCALTVVIFFRFFVLTRIKYGPARYWTILFVFWFLVFGIWASRTHGAHAT